MSMDFGPRRDDRGYTRPLDSKIAENFAPYGKKVISAIQQAALYPRGVANLVQMIGGRIDTDDDGKLAQLAKYLERYGPDVFLIRIGAKKIDEPLSKSEELAPKPPPTAAPTPSIVTPDGYTPPDKFDARGKYIGEERRAAASRRKGPRRTECEAVSKNKRYGRDRRQRKRRSGDIMGK